MCADHCYHGIPVYRMPIEAIHDILEEGCCALCGTPDTPVSPEDWYWIKMRLEIELTRRELGLPVRGVEE